MTTKSCVSDEANTVKSSWESSGRRVYLEQRMSNPLIEVMSADGCTAKWCGGYGQLGVDANKPEACRALLELAQALVGRHGA